jgi:hypothetical protein
VLIDLPDYPASLMAFVSFAGEGRSPAPQVQVIEDGRALFEDLAAGPWNVRVQPVGPAPEGAPDLPQSQVIEVRGGEEAQAEFKN